MRVYGFDHYGDSSVEGFFDVPRPRPSPGTVLVDLRAAGLNPADVKVRAGLRQGAVPVTFPMAMGREAAGTVVEDPSVTFAPGTLVLGSTAAGSGGLAEQVLLDLAGTAAVPDGVSAEQAACIPVAIGTAWDALHELEVGPGDTLLVLGAGGGVGIHAVQLAGLLGATVVGVASSAKAEHVAAQGATHVSSGDGWVERLRQVAPTVDAVIDTVGGDTLSAAASLLRAPHRLRSVADPSLAAGLGGSGVTRRRSGEVYAELAHLVADGALRPVISATYPFDRAAEATAAVATGHTLGKVVVTRQDEPAR